MGVSTRSRAVAAIGAIALVVAMSASGLGQDRSRGGASATPSPDEQAANGPLVGDLSLLADEQSCIEANPNDPWYPTIAAFEVYDSARTHDYVCAHFGGSMTGPNDVFAYVSLRRARSPGLPSGRLGGRGRPRG